MRCVAGGGRSLLFRLARGRGRLGGGIGGRRGGGGGCWLRGIGLLGGGLGGRGLYALLLNCVSGGVKCEMGKGSYGWASCD